VGKVILGGEVALLIPKWNFDGAVRWGKVELVELFCCVKHEQEFSMSTSKREREACLVA
jgi:hypothetical protein